jgi:predicted dehydrogenase
MAKKIRVVLVGCGGICGAWMNTETVQKQVEMVGFVDLKIEAAQKRADAFGAPGAVVGTDMDGVLKTLKPDAVFDCTTPTAHSKVAQTALRHGCHVLNEKPMADSMVNARKMLRAAQKADRIGAVIQNRRYLSGIRSLRNFLDSGKIGKVTTVQSNFFMGIHFGGFRDHMKHVLLLDMAIHTFDAARLICAADPVKVYCREFNPSGSWYDHDASAVAIFDMTDNIVYTYQGSWCAEGCNTSWEAHWRIVGEKGSVLWNGGEDFQAEVVVESKDFKRKCKPLTVNTRCPKKALGGHDGVIRSFVNAIRTGETPETTYADNIKSLSMVEAAIKSAEQGRAITIKS